MGSGKALLMDALQMLMKAHWVLLYDGRCDRAVTDKGVCVRQTVSLAGRCLWLSSMSSLFFQQIATILRSWSDLGADQGSQIKRGRRQVFAVMSENISLLGFTLSHCEKMWGFFKVMFVLLFSISKFILSGLWQHLMVFVWKLEWYGHKHQWVYCTHCF